jgi:hypothetical protein
MSKEEWETPELQNGWVNAPRKTKSTVTPVTKLVVSHSLVIVNSKEKNQ